MSETSNQSVGRTKAASETPRISGAGALQWTLDNIVWIWLVVLILIFGSMNEFFLTVANLQNVLIQATVLGLLGLAVATSLMVAEIDLSIAANMGFSSVLGALLSIQGGLPWWLGMLCGVSAATAIGFFNGLCITWLKMVSLIETLAMMIILQGALLAVTQGNTVTRMSNAYLWIGQAELYGWPVMPVVFFAVLLFGAFFLRNTVPGRCLYAVGGNLPAAEAAGIRANRIKILAFTISGFLSGLAGYLLASWQMAITSDQGHSFLLYAIAAPIIGGVSVFGGRGHVVGILGGVLLLTVIQVGLSIVSVPSFYVGMIGGLMIFVAVAIDAIRVRLRAI